MNDLAETADLFSVARQFAALHPHIDWTMGSVTRRDACEGGTYYAVAAISNYPEHADVIFSQTRWPDGDSTDVVWTL